MVYIYGTVNNSTVLNADIMIERNILLLFTLRNLINVQLQRVEQVIWTSDQGYQS